MIIIESHSFSNNIGDSGASSLSEALKVNSSLTQLNLGVSLLLNMINWLLFNHIPFWTILEIQEQHHYLQHWRLIHHSLNWSWNWVYYWIWLIDYYWITFHLEQYWRIRSNIVVRSIGGQFITHSTGIGNEFIIEYDWLIIIQSHSIYNRIGESGRKALTDALETIITITRIQY